jgi:hypothetical protein
MMGEPEKKAEATPEENVARLIKARESVTEKEVSEPSFEGEYELEEVETLRFETLVLKQQILERRIKDLEKDMGQVAFKVQARLGVPSSGYDLLFSADKTKVRVAKSSRKEEGSGG